MLPAHRATKLIYIPLVLAGWLRYLEGVDETAASSPSAPTSNIEHVRALMGNPKLGDDVSEAQLYPLLANRYYFGVNLFEIGVGETVVRMFGEMNGPARCPRRCRSTAARSRSRSGFSLKLPKKPWFFPVIGTDRRPFQVVRKFPYGNFLPQRSKE